MLRVLEVTFPVFALVFCGFFGQRWRLLPERAVEGINAFVYYFALPAMLFRVVATQPLAGFTDGRFALGYVASGMAVFFFTRAAAMPRRMPRDASRAARARRDAIGLGLAAGHGNLGYLGVPLVLELGKQYAPTIVLAMICDIFAVIMLAVVMLELERRHARRSDDQPSVSLFATVSGGLIRSPLVLSIAAGLGWAVATPAMPEVMDNFVRILASAAGPCALFAIGASLGDRRIELNATVRALLAIKLVAHPALAAGVLFLVVRADPAAAAIGVLAASLPGASNSFIIAQRYGVDTRDISASIVASNFVALATVSIAIWALGLKSG